MIQPSQAKEMIAAKWGYKQKILPPAKQCNAMHPSSVQVLRWSTVHNNNSFQTLFCCANGFWSLDHYFVHTIHIDLQKALSSVNKMNYYLLPLSDWSIIMILWRRVAAGWLMMAFQFCTYNRCDVQQTQKRT
jgi:hypothetical protein